MNRLGRKISRLIEAAGPLSVADYMMQCLFDPVDGYYTTRDPFGAKGDFVTAPEISQMFGELVGAWLVQTWREAGMPLPAIVLEIGPGRGTMMKDIVRSIGRIEPDLKAAVTFALVESSPRLAELQQAALAGSGGRIGWYKTLDRLPDGPLFVACNELFDALPFRQFVRKDGQWLERAVGLDEVGGLRFVTGTAPLDPAALAPEAKPASEGSIFEIAPVRTALMTQIAARIASQGGAGIFFDYGHLETGLGDTFQAVRKHRHEGVFDNPGEADLTSHVDFAALAAAARSASLDAHLLSQGDFLLDMGLLERAGRLGSTCDDRARAEISAAVERLAGPGGMGKLFKVMAIFPKGTAVPGFGKAS